MKFIVAANWKMNKGPNETLEFFSQWEKVKLPESISTLFFVPAVNAMATVDSLEKGESEWGPQNIYPEISGAYTGENSPKVMSDLGAKFCLVGHSERRQLFGESNKLVNQKTHSCLKNNLIPVVCIGETLEERKNGKTLLILKEQIEQGLEGMQDGQVFHIAYEPVWAIGTGEVASPDQVAEAHTYIRKELRSHFPLSDKNVCILYGGSVKPTNAAQLSKTTEVSGFLVGGASLEVESLSGIIEASI